MRIHHIHPGPEERDTLSSPGLDAIYNHCMKLIRQNRLDCLDRSPGERRGR